MKVLTIASLSSLALIGVACSEPSSPAQEKSEPVEETASETTEQAEDSGFTLNLFDENDSGDNGFNIGFEDATDDPLTGFDFGDDGSEGLLSDVPEIDAPMTPVEGEEFITLPEVPSIDEDEIIRIPE